jgi:hypothetical protein
MGPEDCLNVVSPISGGIAVDHALPIGIVETRIRRAGKLRKTSSTLCKTKNILLG